MANTQFVVDLGDVKLSEDQKRSINAAIQKAVTGQLAQIPTETSLALFPIGGGGKGPKWPGPIIWGIIIRPPRDQWIKDIGVMH